VEKPEVVAAAHAAIQAAPVSILITRGADGYPAARPMGTLRVEEDFTVWYATLSASDKCAQIAADPKAAVYWPNLGEGGFAWVMVKGDADLIQDQAVRDRFWQDEFVRYFPGGRTDASYTIVRVTPANLTVLLGDIDSQTVTVPLA
jgi:general stress protein 26